MENSDLLDLISRKDRETITLEWKRRSTLRSRQADIAAGLVSLANRYGGKMIVGVKDSGEFEGKYGSATEVDEDKGRIDDISTQRCSPPIDYTADLVECPSGDVIVINVKRRSGAPHAVIEKKGGEIRERTYYARTSHGKRLLTDSQLEWMFKNPGDYVSRKRFVTKIVYNRENYRMQWFDRVPNPPLHFEFFMSYFIQEHLAEIKSVTDPTKEMESIVPLYLNLLPYSVLELLTRSFANHWNSNVVNPSPDTSERLEMSSVYDTVKDRFDFLTKYLNEKEFLHPFSMAVPKNLKISVDGDSKHRSELRFYIDNLLELKIKISGGSWMLQVPGDHPISAIMNQVPKPRSVDSKVASCDFYFEIDAWLDIFNIEYPNYEDYQKWINRIIDVVESQYSWSKFLERIPDGILYRIDWNLRNLIKTMFPKTEI